MIASWPWMCKVVPLQCNFTCYPCFSQNNSAMSKKQIQVLLNNRTALFNINSYRNVRLIGWFRVDEWNQVHEFFPSFDSIIHHADAIPNLILMLLGCLFASWNQWDTFFLTSTVEFSSCSRNNINFCFTTFQEDFQSLSLQEDAQLHSLLPKSVIVEREKQLLWSIRNNQGHKLAVQNRVAREICG